MSAASTQLERPFGGEMGERVRALDWSETSLGPVEGWSGTMRTAINMMLRSERQIVFFCGPEFVVIYNDAYRSVLGAKDSWALGKPGREVWQEIWDSSLRDVLHGVMRSGEAFLGKDLQLVLERDGFVEHTSCDISYDPVAEETGNVVGVYCIVTEHRSQTLAEIQGAHSRGDADSAWRVNEEKYRSLLSSIDEGFCVIEIVKDATGTAVDYRFIETNSVFDVQTGLSNATGKTVLELVPDLEMRWVRTYASVAESGEPARFEDEAAALGRWYDVFASRVGDAGSSLVAILFRDITDRKRREANAVLLEEISKDLMTLVTPDEIMHTVGGRIGRALKLSAAIFVDVDEPNGEVTVHYGWASGEAPSLKQTFTLRDYLSEEFNRMARAGDTVVIRDTYNDPMAVAANYVALQIGAFIAVPFHWEGKWTEYFAAINIEPRDWRQDEIDLIKEVSDRLFARVERARAEEELRKSQAQLRQDLEDTKQLQVVSGLLIEEDSGNDMLERILEGAMAIMEAPYGSIQLLDEKRNVLKLFAFRGFHPDSAEFWNEVEVGTGSTCGMALRHGMRAIMPDVRVINGDVDALNQREFERCGIVSVMSTPLTTRDGRLVGMISTHWPFVHSPAERQQRLCDVIARQAADFLERIRADQALKESHRRKDEFLATLAHELRNPLAPIRNGAELLRLTGSKAQEQIIDVIDRQTTQLVRLVDDLLEVSRITRGKIELRIHSLDLRQVLRTAVETAEPLLAASQTRFTLELPTEPVYVNGDSVRLGQVFTNLLNNAAKYTETGGRIALILECEGGEAVVHVRDTGTGIPAEMLPRVFDLFTQVDRTLGRSQGGLGIGLALVKSLVEAQGGRVAALSDGPGRGSEFVVRLPLNIEFRESISKLRARAEDFVGALSGKSFIVVDDNRDAANTMALLLRHLGAKVTTAYGGHQALQLLETASPSMMFIDLGMPDMDGCTLAQSVRLDARFASVPLVALTGWGQEQDVRRASEAGFDHHLVKPADARRIVSLMTDSFGANG